ncbi:hypothetical protein MPL3356_60545 [Mesorhizobium plurifarium]|uniref:Uncharacterized protein n=1 Tax=Mesorhizobium plurifarium TaxID=69974 RepID=A0A090EFP5_MESPL|nr:hypothetical protein MPL3356_60545 [Mesorhizobium plurifarium]
MTHVSKLTIDDEFDALIAAMRANIAPAKRPAAPVVAAPVQRAPRFWSWRKVGGLTFVRVGQLSMSFCLTRKHGRAPAGGKRVFAALMLAAAVAVAGQLATRAPACRLVATDAAGNVYIAGAGDTPADALQGAVYPADMIEVKMICRK